MWTSICNPKHSSVKQSHEYSCKLQASANSDAPHLTQTLQAHVPLPTVRVTGTHHHVFPRGQLLWMAYFKKRKNIGFKSSLSLSLSLSRPCRWEKKCFLNLQSKGGDTRTPAGDGSLLNPRCVLHPHRPPPRSLSRMSFTLMSLLETLNHKDNHCQNPSLSQGPAPI